MMVFGWHVIMHMHNISTTAWSSLVFFLLVCYKNHFNIEKPGHNPLILIYKVLKYAWKHTCPQNRSAFTYWEDTASTWLCVVISKYDTEPPPGSILLSFNGTPHLLGYYSHYYSCFSECFSYTCVPL